MFSITHGATNEQRKMGRERRIHGKVARFIFSVEVEMLQRVDKYLIGYGYLKNYSRASFVCRATEEKLRRDSLGGKMVGQCQ